MQFVIRWVISSIAVAAAVLVIPGIDVTSDNAWFAVIFVALLLGLMNATVGLILKIGTIGCIIMTLGLFTLVINAFTLWLASWVAQNWFNVGFVVDGFWPAFWGGIVISIVSGALSWFVRPSEEN